MAQDVVLDSKEWDEFLKKVKANSQKLVRFLQVAANTIGFGDIVKHFDQESGPGGHWAERLPKTQAAYDRIGGTYRSSNKILQLTGRLRQSILPQEGRSQIVGIDMVRMYAGTAYSRTHDEGDPSRNMPKREFMWLSDKAQQVMAEMIRDQLDK